MSVTSQTANGMAVIVDAIWSAKTTVSMAMLIAKDTATMLNVCGLVVIGASTIQNALQSW